MNTKQGTWDAASNAAEEVFDSTTPKPRAGEHVADNVRLAKAIYGDDSPEYALFKLAAERDALSEQLETCKAAHMSNCLDADKLRAQNRELREALEELITRCDGEEGVRADGSNIQTMRASAALAKHGR